MSSSAPKPIRPLVDRRRTNSQERGVLFSSTSSHIASPRGSPVGSPDNNSSSYLVGSPPLRSALKHNHVHPEPKCDNTLEGLGHDSRSSLTLGGMGEADGRSKSSLDVQGSNASLPQFQRRVGFDTFGSGMSLEDKDDTTGGGTGVNYSFTISAKSSEFVRTRWTRTFLVGTDLNEYSTHALDWLLASLTEDNDEVVILRVIEPGSSTHAAWKSGERGMEGARDEAEKVLEQVMEKNGEEKQISIVVEFAVGPIEETIHRMIEIYKPDSLIVGTRGRPDSLFKRGAFMGSISKYCVARSPVPVVVVRPTSKVLESLESRTKRRSYVSLLGLDESKSNNALERVASTPSGGLFASRTRSKSRDGGKEFKRSETVD